MRKRYSKDELTFIESEALRGVSCAEIGAHLGATASAIQHVISRRGIKFCRKPFNSYDGEIWVDCPGIPDVQVSNLGRFVRASSQSLVAGFITTGGYVTVDFSGIGRFSAHRLIAAAFVPNPENKPEVNHKDGNKTNNAVSNLEWVTPSENVLHALKYGLMKVRFGQDHPRVALNEEEIIECVRMRDSGKTFSEISQVFNVGWKTISRHTKLYRRSAERPETIP